LSLLGVASPSLLIHGGVGLDCVGGHARAPTKPCESGVYDDGGACDLSCTRGSRAPPPHSGEGIRCAMHGILRAGLWCAIIPNSPLVDAQPGTASLDPLGDLAHGSLCYPMRGLHGG
jgi:hypothetical protein